MDTIDSMKQMISGAIQYVTGAIQSINDAILRQITKVRDVFHDMGAIFKVIWADLDNPELKKMAAGTLASFAIIVSLLLFSIYGLATSLIIVGKYFFS